MTTYTTLLSGDPQYNVEDWIVTIREIHADDLPNLNKLRGLIRQFYSNPDPFFKSKVSASYNNLFRSFNALQGTLERKDRDLINRVLTIFRQELNT